MAELEKIAYAKNYIEKLANGINPVTNQAIPDADVINNVKISRCLFYVSDLLRQVVENGGISQSKAKAELQANQGLAGGVRLFGRDYTNQRENNTQANT